MLSRKRVNRVGGVSKASRSAALRNLLPRICSFLIRSCRCCLSMRPSRDEGTEAAVTVDMAAFHVPQPTSGKDTSSSSSPCSLCWAWALAALPCLCFATLFCSLSESSMASMPWSLDRTAKASSSSSSSSLPTCCDDSGFPLGTIDMVLLSFRWRGLKSWLLPWWLWRFSRRAVFCRAASTVFSSSASSRTSFGSSWGNRRISSTVTFSSGKHTAAAISCQWVG